MLKLFYIASGKLLVYTQLTCVSLKTIDKHISCCEKVHKGHLKSFSFRGKLMHFDLIKHFDIKTMI